MTSGKHREEVPTGAETLVITAETQRKPTIRDRLLSPWLILSLFVFQVIIAVMVFLLFANQAKFTDYLNGKGAERDREAAVAQQQADARAERSRQVLCDLIAALEADIGGQLQRISEAAHCDEGPIQPGASAPETPQGDEEVTAAPTSNPFPSTDPQPTTGDAGGVTPAPQSPPPAPRPPTTQPPANGPGPSEQPPPPGEQPAPDDGGVLDVCVIILGCVGV